LYLVLKIKKPKVFGVKISLEAKIGSTILNSYNISEGKMKT
jgi:hypothetical protein